MNALLANKSTASVLAAHKRAPTPEQVLQAMVTLHPVVLVHEGRCKFYCTMHDAIDLGYGAGSPFTIDVRQRGPAWTAAARRRAPSVPFPQLWIAGVCHGSYKEVLALHESGKLRDLLRKSGAGDDP